MLLLQSLGRSDDLARQTGHSGVGMVSELTGCFQDRPGCRAAGLIIGARVPIILVSRSDSADSKLASIALGAVIARG